MPLLIFLLILTLLSSVFVSSHSLVTHVVISEIQTGGNTANDEFVELFNPTDCPITIDGWKLTKKTSGGTEANLSSHLTGTIPAHGFFLITPRVGYDGPVAPDAQYSQASNFIAAANNTVILYADQAKTIVVDKLGFGSAVDFEGAPAVNPATHGSLERIGGRDTDRNDLDFVAREVADPQNSQSPPISQPVSCAGPPPPPPTPGEPPRESSGETVLNVSQARGRPVEENVTVSGTVTTRPGQLSTNSFYIQDETGGLQIYSSKKDFPPLTIGHRVKVSGSLAEAYNEKRLRTTSSNDIQVVGSGIVTPRQQRTGEIGESQEGQLVTLSGAVARTGGDTFFIDDGSGEIKILIREITGIDKPRIGKGDTVSVVGIVSQYKEDYRILPRQQDDIVVGSEKKIPADKDEVLAASSQSIKTSVNGGTDSDQSPISFSSRLPQSVNASKIRYLGYGTIILGSLLLVLLPLLLWARKNGWLPGELKRLESFSKNSRKN